MVFLKILENSQQSACARAFFLIKLQAETCNFIKNETLTQVSSYEFCKIFENTFFKEHLWTTTSVSLTLPHQLCKPK